MSLAILMVSLSYQHLCYIHTLLTWSCDLLLIFNFVTVWWFHVYIMSYLHFHPLPFLIPLLPPLKATSQQSPLPTTIPLFLCDTQSLIQVSCLTETPSQALSLMKW